MGNLRQDMLELCGGNPGAMSVIQKLGQAGFQGAIDRIRELKLSGPQIWLVWKDYADFDIDKAVIAFMQMPDEVKEIFVRNCEPLL